MATSQKLTDQFLTCSVCTEVFTDPCTLQCYHTFCRKCVIHFTKTQPDAIAAKSLPCPICRKWTKSSNCDGSVEDWVKQLKPSFLVQGLIDSFGSGTKDMDNCTYCKEVGEIIPATAWCSDCDDALCDRCAKMHKRIPLCQLHDVIGITDEVKVKRKRKVMCKEHKNEKIEFLCKDCKKALCQKCCIIYHRKCESVVTIESQIPTMKSFLTRNKETLLKKLEDLKTETDKKKSKIVQVTRMCSQTETDIKLESQKALDVIKQKEQTLLNELMEIKEKEIGKLKANIKTGETVTQMYRQQTELINQVLTAECEMEIYEMYQSCEAGDEIDTDLEKDNAIDRVSFRKYSDELIKILTTMQLGEIDVLYESRVHAHNDLEGTPVLQDTIDVTVQSDKGSGYPCDVIALGVNGIDVAVVTDFRNNSVKSFYRKNNQTCHSKLTLTSSPRSLTQLNHNQVAVTVPNNKQIVTINVTPQLQLLSTITTSKEYYGITALTPTTLAVSSESPPSVDVITLTGTVIKSLISDSDHKHKLRNPWFLCTTKTGNILVSDLGTNSVLCLTQHGDLVFHYSSSGSTALKNPQGITVTSTGDILVADFPLHNATHLTESGQFVRNILTSRDSLEYPFGLCVNEHGKLFVCLWYKGVIKVFSFVSQNGQELV